MRDRVLTTASRTFTVFGTGKVSSLPIERPGSKKELLKEKKEIPMLKKIAVLAMTLASFGALVPATAAAAERRPVEKQVVVVQKKIVRRSFHARRRTFIKPVRQMRVRREPIVKRG